MAVVRCRFSKIEFKWDHVIVRLSRPTHMDAHTHRSCSYCRARRLFHTDVLSDACVSQQMDNSGAHVFMCLCMRQCIGIRFEAPPSVVVSSSRLVEFFPCAICMWAMWSHKPKIEFVWKVLIRFYANKTSNKKPNPIVFPLGQYTCLFSQLNFLCELF